MADRDLIIYDPNARYRFRADTNEHVLILKSNAPEGYKITVRDDEGREIMFFEVIDGEWRMFQKGDPDELDKTLRKVMKNNTDLVKQINEVSKVEPDEITVAGVTDEDIGKFKKGEMKLSWADNTYTVGD